MRTIKTNATPSVVKYNTTHNVVRYNVSHNVVKSVPGKFPVPSVSEQLENTTGVGFENTDGADLENTGT